MVKYFIKVVELPLHAIMPVIIVLSMVGSYAIRNSSFDPKVVFVVGLLAYFSKKLLDLPLAPIIIGLILGPIAERSLSQTQVMAAAYENQYHVFCFFQTHLHNSVLCVLRCCFMRL